MEGSWGRRSRCRSERRRLYVCYIMGPQRPRRRWLTLHEDRSEKLQNKVKFFFSPGMLFFEHFDFIGLFKKISSLRSSPFIRFLCSSEYVRYDKPRTMEVPKPHPTPPDSGVSLCSPHYHYLHCRHTLDHSVFFAASSSSSLP